MFAKSPLRLAVAASIVAPLCAQAELEVSAELKNETSLFTNTGQETGQARTMLDDRDKSSGDLMKFENSARIFVNGEIGEESSWHAEVRPVWDSQGINSDYQGHDDYTQNDFLRELYVDTSLMDWDLRVGKQQVVWGTADGIKLLDIINPTDFRELNQNAFEDSRIPVWMINAERYFDNGGNLQLIVSQAEENKFPGLNSGGDSGHPFIAKGVDAITGRVNGFLNVAPALADVAGSFSASAAGGGFSGGVPTPSALTGFTGLTVDGFASGSWDITTPGQINPGGGAPDTTFIDPTNTPGFAILNNIAQNGIATGDPNGNNFVTNLMPVTGTAFPNTSWQPSKASSAFELMPNATFATFNTFSSTCTVGPSCFGGFTGISSKYDRDYPKSSNPNMGFRWRNTTDNGLNFSLNYFYHYDANPVVDLSWRDARTGEKLKTVVAAAGDFNADGAPDFADPTGAAPILAANGAPVDAVQTGTVARSDVSNAAFDPANGIYPVSVLLRGSQGYYGAVAPNPTLSQAPNDAELRFTETLNRIHSLGASFDYAFDAADIPVVLRGEFLYDKDTMQPVVDKRLLSIGDLEGALRPEEADFFKYVVGVDVTVATNLLISGQFIQFRNLDFEDDKRTCFTQTGQAFNCSRYTADAATLNLSNGLQKGWKNKEFYSLFLSKPFGDSQLGRWNNIIIYEEGGGYWNRLDAEYTLTDELILSGEINFYFGDDDTLFGQFENSSNVQIGLKYIIE